MEGNDIRFKPGLFAKAYAGGAWLLLDELNLATREVVSSLERALDSDEIIVPIASEDANSQDARNAALTATRCSNVIPHSVFLPRRNPSSGEYAVSHSAQDTSLLSRFLPYEVASPRKDDLVLIAEKYLQDVPLIASKYSALLVESHLDLLALTDPHEAERAGHVPARNVAEIFPERNRRHVDFNPSIL